jgi:hypothetical protein
MYIMSNNGYGVPEPWASPDGPKRSGCRSVHHPHLQPGQGDADKLVWMQLRSSMLVLMSLVLAFSSAGIGNPLPHPVAPEQAHADLHQHSMSGAEHADCLGHEHATAPDSTRNAEHTDEDHSAGDCCKTPLCGCGCVGTNVSVAPATTGLMTVMVHGFVVPASIAIYDSPVLRHLIRPPIPQALQAP